MSKIFALVTTLIVGMWVYISVFVWLFILYYVLANERHMVAFMIDKSIGRRIKQRREELGYSKTVIPAELMDLYNNFVKQINAVLPSIIPGISVELIDIQQEYNETNQQLLSFSIVTVRDNQRISLKYESAGIKKVLCIISSLIAAFNNPDMCFVVDELDSGLFEYLLGQIITVFKDDAKGQLIFTSHNLHKRFGFKPKYF